MASYANASWDELRIARAQWSRRLSQTSRNAERRRERAAAQLRRIDAEFARRRAAQAGDSGVVRKEA